jgi:TRAP-type C4-dicarboxylate transport system permease small subunit
MKRDIIGQLTIVLGATCLILIVVTILTGIVARAVFNYPLSWGVELTTILVIWAVYFVFGVNYRDNTHLSISVFAEILPPVFKKVLECLGDIITAVVAVLMLIHGVSAMRMNYGMTTMALDVSVSLAYYLAAELGCVWLLGYILIKYLRKCKGESAS